MNFFQRKHPRVRGWYCSREPYHAGPCALWPRLWAHPIQWLKLRIR